MNEYSTEKASHHQDRLHVLRNGGQPNPIHLLMFISDLCSHDCSFCAFRMDGHPSNELFGILNNQTKVVNNNPNRMIPYAKVREILDDCHEMGVKAIEIAGGGEPTVHPQHLQIFQDVIDRNLDLALVSHGVLLGMAAAQILMSAKWVRISIDAGTAATYSAIRGVSELQFDRAMRNVDGLVERKRQTGSSVTIGISFVVTKENYREIATAAASAKSLGVDTFRISAVFQPAGWQYFAEIQDEVTSQVKEALRLSADGFRVVTQWAERRDDLTMGSPNYRDCWYQHFTTVIGGDQNVYRCCNTAYNPRGMIGSIRERSFRDLWQSDEKRQKFEGFDARGCTLCHVNARNRAINQEVRDLSHVNFV